MQDHQNTINRLVSRGGSRRAAIAFTGRREIYVGEALTLRVRLVQRLDELQRRLSTYHSFTEPEAADLADRIAAVALAIEEQDALIREERSA